MCGDVCEDVWRLTSILRIHFYGVQLRPKSNVNFHLWFKHPYISIIIMRAWCWYTNLLHWVKQNCNLKCGSILICLMSSDAFSSWICRLVLYGSSRGQSVPGHSPLFKKPSLTTHLSSNPYKQGIYHADSTLSLQGVQTDGYLRAVSIAVCLNRAVDLFLHTESH